jgi:16S rRNA (cytosine1402-N4)-methyltransferase
MTAWEWIQRQVEGTLAFGLKSYGEERLGKLSARSILSALHEGRLAVISFHSLEDRIVKQTFRRLAGIYDGPNRVPPEPLPKVVKLVHPGGLEASAEELASNPPSRSARLRAVERLS